MQRSERGRRVAVAATLAATLAACGGGADTAGGTASGAAASGGPATGSSADAPQVLQAQPRRLGTKVAGTTGMVLGFYWALARQAPGYGTFNALMAQANTDLVGMVTSQTASLSAQSDSQFTDTVLGNMGVNAGAIGAANYSALHDLVVQLLGAYSPAMRGVILFNLANILSGLEGDPIYGKVAYAFNAQVMLNYIWSETPENTQGAAFPASTFGAGQFQGLYIGTLGASNSGTALSMLMLENDEAYALYGPVSGGVFGVTGMLRMDGYGQSIYYSSANVTEYTASGAVKNDVLAALRGIGSNNLSGALGPWGARPANGSITPYAGSTPFNSYTVAASDFNYNTPAQLASITGAWPGALLNGASGTLNVAASGAFSGAMGGCTLSGTLAPRPSGKNVFNLSANFGAGGCALSGAAVSGVAISYTNALGQRQLLMGMTTADHTKGTAFVALR